VEVVEEAEEVEEVMPQSRKQSCNQVKPEKNCERGLGLRAKG